MANDLDSLRRELLLGLVFHGAAAVGSLHQAARGGQRRQPTGRAACCRLLASCVLDVSARPARAWCAGLAHRDCCRRWGGFLGTRRDPAGDRSNDPRCVARAGENARRSAFLLTATIQAKVVARKLLRDTGRPAIAAGLFRVRYLRETLNK